MTNQNATSQTDPLPWLLEPDPDNPGIRYYALTDLRARPDDDDEVQQARAAIMRSGPVPAILDAQHPDGYWVKPGTGYSPKYRSTLWQIIFLAELGADPRDERVRRGCGYALDHSVATNGAFSCLQKAVPSGSVHCLNGNLLRAFHHLGFGEDERVQAAGEWLARSITGEGGFSYLRSGVCGPEFCCSANEWQPCAWGANKALRGLLAFPAAQRSPAMQAALDRGAEYLLEHDPALADYPYRIRISSTWFKLGFPLTYWSDVLETVQVLADLGHAVDPRLDNAVRFVREKADAQGRYKLENSLKGKMWSDIEQQGKPSKWITLRALRMLKSIGTLN